LIVAVPLTVATTLKPDVVVLIQTLVDCGCEVMVSLGNTASSAPISGVVAFLASPSISSVTEAIITPLLSMSQFEFELR